LGPGLLPGAILVFGSVNLAGYQQSHLGKFAEQTFFVSSFFNPTLLDKQTSEKDKHPKRRKTLHKKSQVKALSRRAFHKALDSCFGGKQLRYACLTPTLEFDAK